MRRGPNILPALRRGDVVDVIAPASACPRDELARGLEVLRGWGLVPRVPADLFGPSYIYAHDDAVRGAQLRAALRDPTSRAVWCVRGGYGSARLLPRLARLRPPARAKLFVGLSDVTALHAFLGQRWGWTTVYGPVLTQLGSGRIGENEAEELRRLLFAEQRSLARPDLVPLNDAARSERRIRGALAGGNLKTLQSQLGTPWGLDARGAILCLEDVNERGYAIDRMLVQLVQSGALRAVRAIVFGTFTGGRERDGRFVGSEVLERFAGGMRVPVLTGLPFGHGRADRALPLGMGAFLDLGARGCLRVDWDVER